MRLFTLAASLLAFTSFAQASDSQVETYRYGTKLDIARVISIKAPSNTACELVTAVITYENSHGEVRNMSYTVLADSCHNQN
jgi:hypothetical protein